MAALNDKTRFNLERAQVLLLEPSLMGFSITGQILHGFGVTKPRRCSNPEQAMEIARSDALDLIVCDSSLPDGAAYDFIKALRQSNLDPNRYCPAIIVAGHTPRALVEKARDCGANFVVTKPLSPQVLLERIVWIATESRPFIELDGYAGPDRRFKNLGPPDGVEGRRRDDGKDDLNVAVPDSETNCEGAIPSAEAAS